MDSSEEFVTERAVVSRPSSSTETTKVATNAKGHTERVYSLSFNSRTTEFELYNVSRMRTDEFSIKGERSRYFGGTSAVVESSLSLAFNPSTKVWVKNEEQQ